jgi:hypothetical protein
MMIRYSQQKAIEMIVQNINLALVARDVGTRITVRVQDPLTNRVPPTTCPFLDGGTKQGTSCRSLVDLAIERARDDLPKQDLMRAASERLLPGDLRTIERWLDEATEVGIETGAAHAATLLRKRGLCDRDLDVDEAAFALGVEQGKALLEKTELEVLSLFNKTECNTDVIAEAVYATATEHQQDFVDEKPLCDNPKPASADKSRLSGIERGLRQARQALRVRLQHTWRCNAYGAAGARTDVDPVGPSDEQQSRKPGTAPDSDNDPDGKTPWSDLADSAPEGVTMCACLCQWDEFEHCFVYGSAGNPWGGDGAGIDCSPGSRNAPGANSWAHQWDSTVQVKWGDELVRVSGEACSGAIQGQQAWGAPLPYPQAQSICCADKTSFRPESLTPIVVDLDDDGISLTPPRVPFELGADGRRVRMPAIEGQDALLALDLDGNGRIDSGAELFGDATSCGNGRCIDGIEALAQHDFNQDGRVDLEDPIYGQLQLWRDANRDGASTDDELAVLAEAGIRAIRLESRLMSWSDARGNSSARSLSFVRADGSEGLAFDVWFRVAELER